MAAWLLLGRASREESGPLGNDYNGRNVVGVVQVKRGEYLTFGQIWVINNGEKPVTLRSAELLGDTSGLDVGPVLTAAGDRQLYGVGLLRTFPPSAKSGHSELGTLRPIDGTVVPPQRSGSPSLLPVEVLVGIKVIEPKEKYFTGTRIRYEVDGKEYSYVDPSGLTICPKDECPELDKKAK
ncbi:MAG: hypothetical protein U0Q15_15430 [Kineosporiaceae bacterium]